MSSGPQILTPAYYRRLYALEQQHGWTRGMRDFAGTLLAPLFPSDRDWHILDAGCGTGGMLSWLERFAAAKVIGIDLSSDALRFSHQRGHGALVQGSVISLPFADGSFDLVMVHARALEDLLNHIAVIRVNPARFPRVNTIEAEWRRRHPAG